MMKKPMLLQALLILALLLTGCRMPRPTGSDETPGSTSGAAPGDAAYTAAAQTIVAQLTLAATTPVPAETGAAETGATPSILPQNTTPPPAETAPPTETQAPEVSPTPEMTATATPEPSDTPGSEEETTAIPTLSGSDPAQSLGDPDWQNSFESEAGWPLYSDENVDFDIDEDGLTMVAKNANGWDSWMLANPDLEDFYLEMTATPQDCDSHDRYGLFFRGEEENEGYLFAISCNGQYSLRVWNGKAFNRLVDWTSSSAILVGEGQTNRIGVMARGDNLSLYANGVLLIETPDSTYSHGRFGVFIGASNTPEFTTRVSRIAYWEIQ